MNDLSKIVLTALTASFLTVLLITGFQPEVQKIIQQNEKITTEEKIIREESAIIDVVKKASSSVVSVVVTKEMPKVEQFGFFGWEIPGQTEKQEISGGTGFVVSNGLILTNKHVASGIEAQYTIATNQGKKIKAEILAIDPIFDIAILKADTDLPALKLGDSSKLEVGQTVIAIGNALGEFQNTVSVGVVSGLKRSIGADLRSLIQTDAAINSGNSGGPLLNLMGQVVGINTARANNAENIGFAIPIDNAKKAISDAKTKGKIEYPFLGIRYNINNHLVLEVSAGSPAEQAGILANDILLEFDNQKLTDANTLADVILKYKSGDKVKLKILRNGQEKVLSVVLGTR